ncbi:hypothetical protein [Actinomyces minihominis]|uniref:hypothetical protein n=1 Tax=Actinomyces minihominis TaxID=2002838 RepID=UPI000C075E40|nr:hypothetical protein [Actinomyces minihominis]
MGVLVFVLALVFAVAAGGLFMVARVSQPRKRAYFTGAAGVALIQALTFGVMATYPAMQLPGYIIIVALVGVVLVLGLVYLGSRVSR